MSIATRGAATAVGFASLMIIYRLLGIDQMASVFKKRELQSKYDYIIGNFHRIVNLLVVVVVFVNYLALFLFFTPQIVCLI